MKQNYDQNLDAMPLYMQDKPNIGADFNNTDNENNNGVNPHQKLDFFSQNRDNATIVIDDYDKLI